MSDDKTTGGNIMVPYSSEAETRAHQRRVANLLMEMAKALLDRAMVHDNSKLGPAEKPAFDEATPRLKTLTYGTPEYKASLDSIRPALTHHNAMNSHHPEHHEGGIDGMDLLDLVEMLCDWKAATERHADGDIRKSLEHNKGRFKIGKQLASILGNTILFVPIFGPKRPVKGSRVRVESYEGFGGEGLVVEVQGDGTYLVDLPSAGWTKPNVVHRFEIVEVIE